MWSSYVATFNDIDRKTCRILFRCEKMRLENNIASGSRFRTKEWEDLLIDNVTDDSKIVLAGACKNCLKASPIVVDYLKYLKGILTSDERMYATTCPKCKSQRTFYILPGKDSKDSKSCKCLGFFSGLLLRLSIKGTINGILKLTKIVMRKRISSFLNFFHPFFLSYIRILAGWVLYCISVC